MGKRIGIVVALLIAAAIGYYAYQRHLATQVSEGDVTMEDSGPRTVADTPTDAPIVQKTTAPAVTRPATVASSVSPAAVPASDSISPNPANGLAFSGSGKFQVYRQGNLTWRVDTESGSTCILFATMEEWKKPLVFQHGCANS